MPEISAPDKAELYLELRLAIMALADCWDHLREAETMLECEIEVDQISGFTFNCGTPPRFSDIADEDLEALVKEVTTE